jgi:hypothetical protein
VTFVVAIHAISKLGLPRFGYRLFGAIPDGIPFKTKALLALLVSAFLFHPGLKMRFHCWDCPDSATASSGRSLFGVLSDRKPCLLRRMALLFQGFCEHTHNVLKKQSPGTIVPRLSICRG